MTAYWILGIATLLVVISCTQTEDIPVKIEQKPSLFKTKEWQRDWRRVKYQAYKTYGARCHLCGRTAEDGAKLQVDHVRPKSKYPHLSLDIENLQILCDEHNWSKSNTDETDWR